MSVEEIRALSQDRVHQLLVELMFVAGFVGREISRSSLKTRISPVAVHLVADVTVVQLQKSSQVVDMPVGVQRQVFVVTERKTAVAPQLLFIDKVLLRAE